MLLLIFESIGTQELVIIGVVALMFLGPRKLPEYAKKMGKLMADLRSTTGEFKETWEREVNFEEEARALRLDDDFDDETAPALLASDNEQAETTPEIKAIDRDEFEKRTAAAQPALPYEKESGELDELTSTEDKRNWL